MNNNPIQALLGILNKLNPKQKFMLGGGILITLALLIALIFLMNEPTYTSLYSGLSQEDASKVIEYLGAQKIIYKICSDISEKNSRQTKNMLSLSSG